MLQSSSASKTFSALPGESGSLAEAFGVTDSLIQTTSNEETGLGVSNVLTGAFNFTGTSASSNGATMQEYFIQTVVSFPNQHELLLTRLRGLCREWSNFCDQEIVFELNTTDTHNEMLSNLRSNASGNSSAAAGVLASNMATLGSNAVTARVRRSLLSNANPIGREFSVLRYLGAVETDKLVSRRSCLEIPVSGPLISFLSELGFAREFTYVAEGYVFIRGRVKILVYTVNEITLCHNPGEGINDPIPSEWRRVCPRSWLLEISAVGSPAEDSLQTEVSEFYELLCPLVVPANIDHNNLYNRK